MKTTRSIVFFIILISIAVSCSSKINKLQVSSPDGKITLSLFLCAENSIKYYVTVQEGEESVELIESSPMGIKRVDTEFVSGLKLKSAGKTREVQETYTMVSGTNSEYSYQANERIFEFKNKKGNMLQVHCRAYNDGVAFRYVFPEKVKGQFEVTGETTGFNLPMEGKTWLQPYDSLSTWSPAYERSFVNKANIGITASANCNGWAFPMLFETLGYWVFISEAGLDTSYCGSHLEAEALDGLYSIRFPEKDEADNYFKQNPVSGLPWHMPWRFILISQDLQDVFNSSRVNDLSAPPVLEDTGWIYPGIASWSWWSDGESPGDFESQKAFVDFAARMGFEYCLIDEGWHEMEGGNISQLVEYADQKGVGILLWYDSGGRVEYAKEEQRKIMFNPETRSAEMKKIAEMGVKGIKVDFFHSEKQGMIKHYHNILKDAAEHKLMVNFHGCTLPRGWSRTYPHLMTMEAVRGEENYRYNEDFPLYAPVHNTIIPFTRNVAGPMDYTPVVLSDSEYPHLTSVAHELALAVVFSSGIVHLADHYKMYESLPEPAKEYLEQIPASWDESILLTGYPGSYVVVARRKGEKWFIAGINGEGRNKIASFNFRFMSDTTYRYILLTDGRSRNFVQTQKGIITPDRSSDLNMNPWGGFTSVLIPVEE